MKKFTKTEADEIARKWLAGEPFVLPKGVEIISNPRTSHGEFAHAVRQQALSNTDLLLAKHADYGPKNIAQAPGGALNGLRVRMHDKLARINHLIDTGATPENESLADSFMDLANYALIAQLVLRGEWPSE